MIEYVCDYVCQSLSLLSLSLLLTLTFSFISFLSLSFSRSVSTLSLSHSFPFHSFTLWVSPRYSLTFSVSSVVSHRHILLLFPLSVSFTLSHLLSAWEGLCVRTARPREDQPVIYGTRGLCPRFSAANSSTAVNFSYSFLFFLMLSCLFLFFLVFSCSLL